MTKITIKIIYDNCKENAELQEGWGFAAYVEIDNRRILFDIGNDREAFFSNSAKMGIDLQEITDVIFSHKHADHIAGCEEILKQLPENTRLFLPKGFPLRKVPKNLQMQIVSNFAEIEENIFSMALKCGFFLYEQSLILQTEKGLVILTGCAHPGIVNILEKAQEKFNRPIYLILGGFHLFRKNCHFIDDVVNKFQSLQVKQVAPCHCSGELTIKKFQETYLQDFHKIGTGSVLIIS